MPKTIKQFEEIKNKRINQILNISLKLFCDVGYDAISVDDICKKAKISHGLFYHYFTSKRNVYNEIFQRGEPQISFIENDLLSPSLKGLLFLEKLNSTILFILRKNDISCYYLYFIIESAFMHRDKHQILKKLDEKIFKKVLQAIKEAQDLREICPGNPKELLFTYVSLLLGLTVIKMKNKENYAIPSDDIVMNLFYRKGLIK